MITVKVFPTLRSYLSPEISGNTEFPLELANLDKKEVSVEDLIAHLKIPSEKVYMAIINGIILKDKNHVVKDGDTIMLSTAIGGG